MKNIKIMLVAMLFCAHNAYAVIGVRKTSAQASTPIQTPTPTPIQAPMQQQPQYQYQPSPMPQAPITIPAPVTPTPITPSISTPLPVSLVSEEEEEEEPKGWLASFGETIEAIGERLSPSEKTRQKRLKEWADTQKAINSKKYEKGTKALELNEVRSPSTKLSDDQKSTLKNTIYQLTTEINRLEKKEHNIRKQLGHVGWLEFAPSEPTYE
jgi:hypothetical protein